jgi:hypothetical protein
VFELEPDELPKELRYRSDPANPEGHGFIEPTRRMSFEEYQRLLHSTCPMACRRTMEDIMEALAEPYERALSTRGSRGRRGGDVMDFLVGFCSNHMKL